MQYFEEIWRFETARFAVIGEAAPETDFDYDGEDEDGEIAAAIASGEYAWFVARVRVVLLDTGETLGTDYLGGCCYAEPSDVFRADNYGRAMVAQAVQAAREHVATLASLSLRAPARV